MTRQEALMELMDHLGEVVAVGIQLQLPDFPAPIPWAGTEGTLSHGSQEALDDWPADHPVRPLVLHAAADLFLIGDFRLPLDERRVVKAWPTEGLPNPGLNFAIGVEGKSAVTVRVTFKEHERGEDNQ